MNSQTKPMTIVALTAVIAWSLVSTVSAQKTRKSKVQSKRKSGSAIQNLFDSKNNSRLDKKAATELAAGQRLNDVSNQQNSFSQNTTSNSTRFKSRMKRKARSVQVTEEAQKRAQADALGRIAQPVTVRGNTMVRRRYSEQALQKIIDSGVLTREQAERANAIGRSR